MRKVIYCCVNEHSLEVLKDIDGTHFISVPEADLYGVTSKHKNTYDGLILGEEIRNPINHAQKIYSIDQNISIVILSDGTNYSKYKQALKFTPFIGNTIQCISTATECDLKTIIHDITEKTKQRRNYSQLKSTVEISGYHDHVEIIKKEYLDKYLEKAPIGAVLLDNDGLVLAVNDCTTEIFSLQENEILGMGFSNLFTGENKKRFESFIEKGFYNNSKKAFERVKDEIPQHLEITLALIAPTNSRYKIAIVNDITDKILSEQQITAQLIQLESLNSELVTTNENLRKTNKELDNFIYTASHDLKAPILNIEGLVKALEKELKNPGSKITTILNLITKSIEKFKETIIDLTEVSKIENELREDIMRVNLSAVVEEVKLLIHDTITSNFATIHTDFSLVPEIHFSKKNLKSIIYNLLSNSIKYRSPDRNPIINISSSISENYTMLTFSDNGIGFHPEKKERIFEMFKRLHNHVEGTGVGLYIVKKIIDYTGGRIEVESEIDRGTTFQIFLKSEDMLTLG